jgi:adenylate cyclase
MARDTYEVYYYQSGRWSLHASFEGDQREQAVAEGMNVEAKLGYPARVIKETFFPETNTSEEVVAWQGAKGKSINDADNMFGQKQTAAKPAAKRQAPPPPRVQAAPQPKKKAEPPKQVRKPAPRPKKKEEKGALAKIVFSFLMSGTIATVAAAIVGTLLLYFDGFEQISEADRIPLVFGSFVLIFFVTLLLLLNREFKLLSLVFGGKKPKSSSRAMQSPMMRNTAPAKAKPAAALQEDEFSVEVERGAEVEAEPNEEEKEDELPPDLDADMGTASSTPPELEPEPEPEPAPAQAQAAPAPQQAPAPQAPAAQAPRPEPKPEPKSFAVPEPKVVQQKPPAEATPAEAEARKIFASFVTTAQATVQAEIGELNAFSRFGMSLLLSGALSSLGQAKKLAREPQLNILKQGLSAIGNTPDRTQTFCAELPGYGKNPRYTPMIQSGSKAMTAYMGGNNAATKGMGSMLQEWSKPEKRTAVPSIFTFVFTDITGSTATTQAMGNHGAQRIVRAHNTAVRNGLAKHRGREVKHMGDGIMAVFTDAASAVHACIQAQRELAAHNQAHPDLPVVVRIGINSGEAVEEDNDFFGAAVQMTARICSKATDGNIWVSQSVIDGCKGQRLGFIPRGKYEMKGIQGAKPLYEVGWTEKHKNELADL